MICQRRAMLFAEWLLVALDCFTWKLCKNTVEKCPNFLPNSIWEHRYTPSKSEEFVDNGPLSTRCQQPSTQLSTAEPQPRTRKLGENNIFLFQNCPKTFPIDPKPFETLFTGNCISETSFRPKQQYMKNRLADREHNCQQRSSGSSRWQLCSPAAVDNALTKVRCQRTSPTLRECISALRWS